MPSLEAPQQQEAGSGGGGGGGSFLLCASEAPLLKEQVGRAISTANTYIGFPCARPCTSAFSTTAATWRTGCAITPVSDEDTRREAEGQGHPGGGLGAEQAGEGGGYNGKVAESESKPSAPRFPLHQPWHVLKMFIGAVIEGLCLVGLSLIPNLSMLSGTQDNTESSSVT